MGILENTEKIDIEKKDGKFHVTRNIKIVDEMTAQEILGHITALDKAMQDAGVQLAAIDSNVVKQKENSIKAIKEMEVRRDGLKKAEAEAKVQVKIEESEAKRKSE